VRGGGTTGWGGGSVIANTGHEENRVQQLSDGRVVSSNRRSISGKEEDSKGECGQMCYEQRALTGGDTLNEKTSEEMKSRKGKGEDHKGGKTENASREGGG